jgi:fatty acid desaturase
VLMYPGCAIFCLSPHLWRIWHNTSHHAHTNQPDEDPDTFGTLSNFLVSSRTTRSLVRRSPGSRSWSSVLYLFTFFTLQAQTVLWAKSRTLPGYKHLRRARAGIDSALLLVFWIAIGLMTGVRGALLIVLVPMLVANFVVLAYVVTNHMLRPLTDSGETLTTTMSVRTTRLLDRIHFHFSHHVEHHLFPRLPSSMTPHVRRSLMLHFGNEYLAPSHGLALLWIFRTPRLYDDFVTLVDPDLERRVDLRGLESSLRIPSSLARGL